MARVFISLGSNLGDRLRLLQRAVDAVASAPTTTVRRLSSVYETEPVGVKNQPEFLNAVAELESALAPPEMFHRLKEVESLVGRMKSERWGPREIDLDLLYYDSFILQMPDLTIPHPEIHRRRFVLVPLAEIAENFLDPVTRTSMKNLLNECSDASVVKQTSLKLSSQP
ncbi:MAG TPA: 2-amino-4-hydroxy-6-hydroxymethyldihydropteridine diphosphokinase [Bacteroidota bacterium]